MDSSHDVGQINSDLENDIFIDGENEHLNSEEIADEKLDELAALIVEKILSSQHFEKLSQPSEIEKTRSENIVSARCPRRESRKRNSQMRDLIDNNKKPLELNRRIQFAEQYLKAIKSIYCELAAELGEEFFITDDDHGVDVSKLLRSLDGNGSIVELLYRLEKFVLILAYSSTPGYMFDDEPTEDLDNESLTQIKSRITALGYELLYFLDNLETIRRLNTGKYISSSIQIFLNFSTNYQFRANARMQTNRNLLDEEIYFSTLHELNYILRDLKSAMIKGEVYDATINPSQMFRRVRVQNSIFLGMGVAEFKADIQKYSKKLQDAISYFRGYKSKSITLYRMRIWLDNDQEQVTLDQFKLFFSELNKKAAKPNVGFKGYLNYFYIWDQFDDQWFQDIVLIMDSNTLLITEDVRCTRNITQEFQRYASELLANRAEAIFGNQMIPKIEIKSVPLMYHLDMPSQLLIEAKDREMWKLFEDNILPFFIYHEFLELNLDEEISNRFRRGTKKIEQ